MRTVIQFVVVALVLVSSVRAAGNAVPDNTPKDPAVWAPPTQMSKIIPRVTLDTTAMINVRAQLKAFLDKRSKLPARGMEVSFVEAGSLAEKAGIVPGDILLKLDDKPLALRGDFSNQREKPQKIVLFRPGIGEMTVEVGWKRWPR